MGSEEYLTGIIQDKEKEIERLKEELRQEKETSDIIFNASLNGFSKNLELKKENEQLESRLKEAKL